MQNEALANGAHRAPEPVVAKRVPLARSNPLFAHVGAGHKAIPPLACKHAMESGF